MRVILDTNVLLGSLISREGAPHVIYRAWRSRRFELVTSEVQLDELRRVTRYPKLRALVPPYLAGALVNKLQRAVVLQSLPALESDFGVRDPQDVYLLSMAQACQADYLVTGDRRAGLLQLGRIGRTRILTPAEFSARVLFH